MRRLGVGGPTTLRNAKVAKDAKGKTFRVAGVGLWPRPGVRRCNDTAERKGC